MSEDNLQDKTEKPTPKRRKEHREKGEVAKSKELASVAVILSGLITLTLFGSITYTHIQMIMKTTFTLPLLNDFNISELMIFLQNMTLRFIGAILPLLVAVFITAILSNIIQVGFVLSGELITPKLSKIDPIKGLGRLFSKQSFMELFKSCLKLAIVGGIAYHAIQGEMDKLPLLGNMEIQSIFTYILTTFFKISIRCILAMIFLVVIDYAFQRWEFEQRIKMSKQEIKDEYKKTEGDPLIKARIKSVQMEMARKRMMQAVPHADVVITNPTHFAVAIKYDAATMKAPKVIAKGAQKIAQKIRELAEKHEIPVMENKQLAQSLYKFVEINQEIPPDLYQAVAEVLAYIYKLKRNYAYGLE
ncbi:MAG: flagellar biosynthesis protein FlhB [Proteobacteria bacterium]|nr:flagellar biosynthesis protein FlhB [Pseudomonadota bacterium]